MYLIGYDIGSSSVKASLVDSVSGAVLASDFFPKTEMPIMAAKQGWAEQNPSSWWENLCAATNSVLNKTNVDTSQIAAIGISYQMHGLVVVDKDHNVLRPAIIWCDSRAVEYGNKAFDVIGNEYLLERTLNSPGNFTASKLAWVKDNEPELFEKIYKFMLPGDYIAMMLSGDITTTASGLSEGVLWDFKNETVSSDVMKYYGFDMSLVPDIVPTFGIQCKLSETAAKTLSLRKDIPITYRAGDQPNNALSLGVLNAGEIASTAGTSGVIYGVNDKINYDKMSRVNTFAHVNHTKDNTRLGILLCINGTGSLNSWCKRNLANGADSYVDMNNIAASSPIGSKGISILPFGNGAERMLCNKDISAHISGVNFNIHDTSHLLRAAQEGVAFSFMWGMDIMKQMGLPLNRIKAGYTNMFLSDIFAQTLSDISESVIELYDTDGAAGAAKGAGVGAGVYNSIDEAFETLNKLKIIEPKKDNYAAIIESYQNWCTILNEKLK